MATALITGGTGFVGSHLVRVLADAGHTPRVLHRRRSRLTALQGLHYETALGDVLETDALLQACAGCDWVFHVAAVADYWRASTEQMFNVNVEGTRRVLWAARQAGVPRVVLTSSAAAVGVLPGEQPADERVPFNLPPRAFPYGYSKVLAEQVAQEAVAEYGQDVVIVNPVVVFGPGDLNQISGSFVTQIRRYQWAATVTSGGVAVVDVRDVARWHLAAAERGRSGERYILGTANSSYRALFALIAQLLDVTPPKIMVPDAVLPLAALGITLARRLGMTLPVDANQARLGSKCVYFDFRKAWGELGEPQIDLETSLRDTVRWYAENGYLQADGLAQWMTRAGRLLGW